MFDGRRKLLRALAAALALALLRAAPAHADDPVLVPPKLASSTAPEDPPPTSAPAALPTPPAPPPVADPTADSDPIVVTARVERPPREVTKHTLERDELAAVAGARGDPLRGVELMPGVSRPPAAAGLPVLRGANPYDSQVFMEGSPVPTLYHLGGLTSFVHSRVLDDVALYPSNFSVRYGRKMGGVIEATLRDPRTDGWSGIAELSLLDSSLLIEAPITTQLSVLGAVRRSNIDAVLNSATDNANFTVDSAPVYWDYQAVIAYEPTERDRVRLLAYGSSDRFEVIRKAPAAADPSLRDNIGSTTTFQRVQLAYRHTFGGGSAQNTELTYGHETVSASAGEVAEAEYELDNLQLRSEWVAQISPALRATAGADVLGAHFRGRYSGIQYQTSEGDRPLVSSTQRPISVAPSEWTLSPGVYLDFGIRPIRELLITPGIRADYSTFYERGSVDPRLSSRLELTDTTAIKAGVGKFTQQPTEAEAVIGAAELELPRALHVSAGVEQQLTEVITASLEGFAKWMDRVTTPTPQGRAPYFDNSQRGRTYGAELLLRVLPVGGFFGFVSYTLMRSERTREDGTYRLFERDQTHILGATGVYRLGRGWEVGTTVRYTSGTPYTPVVSSTYEATQDVYQPRLGRSMSARNPAFSCIDARVQKTWTFSAWSLAVYLDVQNALNSENAEGFTYSHDYSRRKGTRGLPILPIIGVRGEL